MPLCWSFYMASRFSMRTVKSNLLLNAMFIEHHRSISLQFSYRYSFSFFILRVLCFSPRCMLSHFVCWSWYDLESLRRVNYQVHIRWLVRFWVEIGSSWNSCCFACCLLYILGKLFFWSLKVFFLGQRLFSFLMVT